MSTRRAIRAAVWALVAAGAFPDGVDAQAPDLSSCGRATADIQAGWEGMPDGLLFCPLSADRREPTSHLAWVDLEAPWLESRGLFATIGDRIPLFRWSDAGGVSAVQFSVAAGVVSLFDADVRSFDLILVDYFVGFPMTARRGAWSIRVRPFHWSSHLGDEFLLRDGQTISRREVSLEAVEAVIAHQWGPLRGFAGGEWWIDRVPDDLPAGLGVLGAEVRPGKSLRIGSGLGVEPVAAIHLRWSQVERGPSLSARAGVELGSSGAGRRLALQFEWFRGQSPLGQFWQSPLRFFGVSLSFG